MALSYHLSVKILSMIFNTLVLSIFEWPLKTGCTVFLGKLTRVKIRISYPG